jgi:hypothetical protein
MDNTDTGETWEETIIIYFSFHSFSPPSFPIILSYPSTSSFPPLPTYSPYILSRFHHLSLLLLPLCYNPHSIVHSGPGMIIIVK